jgi:hypothetical protein
MKDCCKTGDEKPPSRPKKLATRTLWFVVLAIVAALAVIQMFNL